MPTAKNGMRQPHMEIQMENGTVASKNPKLPDMPAKPSGFTNSFTLNHVPKMMTTFIQIVASPIPTSILAAKSMYSFAAKLNNNVPIPFRRVPAIKNTLGPKRSDNIPIGT